MASGISAISRKPIGNNLARRRRKPWRGRGDRAGRRNRLTRPRRRRHSAVVKKSATSCVRETIDREAPVKKLVVSAALFAIAFNAANAGPLPDAKPDEVGFSQQGLARMDDFFAREIAAKRVPGAVVAIARDGRLVHYRAYGQLDPAKGTAMPTDAVFALA